MTVNIRDFHTVISILIGKKLLSRNFCQKCVTVNFSLTISNDIAFSRARENLLIARFQFHEFFHKSKHSFHFVPNGSKRGIIDWLISQLLDCSLLENVHFCEFELGFNQFHEKDTFEIPKIYEKAEKVRFLLQNFVKMADFLGTRIIRVFDKKYSRFE